MSVRVHVSHAAHADPEEVVHVALELVDQAAVHSREDGGRACEGARVVGVPDGTDDEVWGAVRVDITRAAHGVAEEVTARLSEDAEQEAAVCAGEDAHLAGLVAVGGVLACADDEVVVSVRVEVTDAAHGEAEALVRGVPID